MAVHDLARFRVNIYFLAVGGAYHAEAAELRQVGTRILQKFASMCGGSEQVTCAAVGCRDFLVAAGGLTVVEIGDRIVTAECDSVSIEVNLRD